MPKQIDARGLHCPAPVILTKRELDAGETDLCILADNRTAAQNLTRLGESSGCTVTVSEQADIFSITLRKTSVAPTPAADPAMPALPHTPAAGDWALLVTRDTIGEGNRPLGETLIKMYFYTLTQSTSPPSAVFLLHAGVKLAAQNEQVAEHLRELEQQGTAVVCCGTCLNYYGLTDALSVGRIGNMYDIVSQMQSVGKVVTL